MRIMVCTMFGLAYKGLADICVPNLQEYCQRHGYIPKIIKVNDNDCWFYKHKFFTSVMSKGEADIIFYCDIDSLITNHTLSIENFIDKKYSFYITRDFNELNGGVVVIKNDRVGRMINSYVLSAENKYENEQNVYNSEEFKDFNSGFYSVLPHPSFNSYQYSLYPECSSYVGRQSKGDWQQGDFLIHFPGLPIEKRIELMNEYLQKVTK